MVALRLKLARWILGDAGVVFPVLEGNDRTFNFRCIECERENSDPDPFWHSLSCPHNHVTNAK